MRRVLISISALLVAIIAVGASKQSSRTPQNAATSTQVIEVNKEAPQPAPSVKPDETPVVQAPEIPSVQASPDAYQLNWYSINGGGAINASSPNYKMGLSVGQPVAGAASGTNYKVGIGFWYGAAAGGSCPIVVSGDVNTSGTVTSADIIVLVNYVFKGGATPQPCAANGDVNCNNAVTSSDIIVLVNYVFKAGPAPCNTCTSPLAASC